MREGSKGIGKPLDATVMSVACTVRVGCRRTAGNQFHVVVFSVAGDTLMRMPLRGHAIWFALVAALSRRRARRGRTPAHRRSAGSTAACRRRSSTAAHACRLRRQRRLAGLGELTPERLALLRAEGAQVFAEFNTMHEADYLKEHPDAAPVGARRPGLAAAGRLAGGLPDPPGLPPVPDGRVQEAAAGLRDRRHLARLPPRHASWEQAEPDLPDTCFCARCLGRFQDATGIRLPDAPTSELAALLLATHREAWVRWRLDVFTDWVREFRAILRRGAPAALLGTFHCPWSDEDYGGARREKLAIDLKAQAEYLDVFSPMPYHARFGHADDPAWISRQVAWLGELPGHRGQARRAATNLADRAALRLGRSRCPSSRSRPCSSTARAGPRPA